MQSRAYDVVVLGGGVAGLSAALSAAAGDARVCLVDRAPAEARGGNTAFATGSVRTTFSGPSDLRELVPNLSEAEVEGTDFGSYSVEEFYEDLARLSNYRIDPDLAFELASRSYETLRWLRGHGVSYVPIYGRQSVTVDGRRKFFGSLVLEVSGGGRALVDVLTDACARAGVEVVYGVRAVDACYAGEGGAKSVTLVDAEQRRHVIDTRALILATGGFEGDASQRAQYLGPGWDLARVRGTPFATGDGQRIGISLGGKPHGHWSGCHAVAWDANAPEFGLREDPSAFTRHGYPWGIVVNERGERFLDEGRNFRNYTYGEYGAALLQQPGQHGWHVFDSQVVDALPAEYHGRRVTRAVAPSLEKLAEGMATVDAQRFVSTVAEFNAAVDTSRPLDYSVLDGRGTPGLAVPKSNWALPIAEPPFYAFEVTAGVSFTYGGLQVDTDARVLDTAGAPLAGVFAAGAAVGGVFYGQVASGTSLTSGAVFGMAAGRAALEFCR